MGRRKNKKKSHLSAYNPTDTPSDATEGGTTGGLAFFHYHPGGSGINQSWWLNTFGKQQEPLLKAEDPSASTSSETKNGVRSGFPLEPKSYDTEYREYRPPSPVTRPLLSTASPPPPQGPSSEYIVTANDPSHLLTDPESSRKLLVLDLNGTLLHRSPRSGKSVPRYPTSGQEGFQPRLRPVHPRPYLPSFKSYIFHPSNKEWLDVMVWSSAQPHSVHDMVNKCFDDEKRHFVAVWARDTLGLPPHLYNRKVQTLKDLNVPWSKLFTPSNLSGAGSHPTSHHNALSTLLMDDSLRKAELQPFNHLCVKEYSNIVRNRDLTSLQVEKTQLKPPSPPSPGEVPESHPPPPPPPQLSVEIPRSLLSPTVHHQQLAPFELPPAPLDPPQEFQFDQSVGIQPGATLLNPLPLTSNIVGYPGLPGDNGLGRGGVIAPQMLFKNPSPPMLGYQNPQAFQQLNRSINPFTSPKHTNHPQPQPHHPPTNSSVHPVSSTTGASAHLAGTAGEEPKASSDSPPSTSASKKRKRKANGEIECKTSSVDSTHAIEYDETLLAVVGILDEVKLQSNVASWVKTNGLWGPYPPQDSVDADVLTHDHFRKDSEISSDSGSADSGRLGEGKKKHRVAFVDATVEDRCENRGSVYAPTNEKPNQQNVSETPSWFDDPRTMQHWVDRGRKALTALGISIEHGLKQ